MRTAALAALSTVALLGACLPRSSTRTDAGSAGDASLRLDDLPNGVIDAPYEHVTLQPGEAFRFRGKVVCPEKVAPCSYTWSFGNGQTSTLRDPGDVVYAAVGFYTATFTVVDAKGRADPTPSRLRLAVWSGEFKDDFQRPTLDWEKDGWRRPFLVAPPEDPPLYSIDSGTLKVTGDWTRPGSTAILAWPLVEDCRIEVTKRRHADAKGEHFADVVLRMHPSGNIVSFIRVRLWEEAASASPGQGNGIELAIFKITRPEDEHGFLINDEIKEHAKLHTVCNPGAAYGACPYLQGFPRAEDIRLVVEVHGNKITARASTVSKPSDVLLSASATDDLGAPYLYAGTVGLTHFEGLSYFDDFLLRRL